MTRKTLSQSRGGCNIFTKTLLGLLLSLIFSLPSPAQAYNKTLVLFPLVINTDRPVDYIRQGVKSMLVFCLSEGDFELIGNEVLGPLLKGKEKEGISSKKRAEELTKGLKADYAIFGTITTTKTGSSLDLSLLELTKMGCRLTAISETIDKDRFIPRLAEVAYQFREKIEGREKNVRKMQKKTEILPKPETAKGLFSKSGPDKQVPPGIEKGLEFRPARDYQGLKPTGRFSVDMAVMAFDVGDLDAKAGAELAVLGRKKLSIYKRQGNSFVLKDSLKAGIGEDFLKVSVGDADNNGKDEIYLVSRYGTRARSTVLEWTGKFERLYRRIGHMQVIRDLRIGRPVLLFQDSRVREFFSGKICIMGYGKDAKPAKREKLPELRGARFYTLRPFDLDKGGGLEWLGLGKGSRLYVWSNEGKILWKGNKQLGGTSNAIRLGDTPSGDLPPRISFDSKLVVTDIDGDGQKEILAVKNIPIIEHTLNFKVYDKSRLVAYRLEAGGLSPAWTTRDINYCLTDIQTMGQTLFLAAQRPKVINLRKGSGCIMWFE